MGERAFRHTDCLTCRTYGRISVLPALNQIEVDAGEIVHRLAAGRLGVESHPESVREQAERMGVTHAPASLNCWKCAAG